MVPIILLCNCANEEDFLLDPPHIPRSPTRLHPMAAPYTSAPPHPHICTPKDLYTPHPRTHIHYPQAHRPHHPTHPHPTLLHPWDPYPHIPIQPHSLPTHPHSPTPKHTHTPLPHSPVSHILVSMEREVPALGGCLRQRPTEKKAQRPI